MSDVVVLGSLNMDLVVRTPEMPRPGETVHGSEFTTIPGGKGANQAAAAARLGASVDMIGRVGDDSFGPALLSNMRSQGVQIDHVAVDLDASSGIAMIIVDGRGENSIVVAPGANGRVSVEDLEQARGVLQSAQFLVMQFEVPLITVRAAIALARELGLQVVLNPAPAYSVDRDFLNGVTHLVVNETEAQLMSGLDVSDLSSAQRAGEAIRKKMDIPHVIVTLGELGALLVSDEITHVPTHVVEVVDTTAAGDAFVGGLTAGLLRGLDLVQAVRYATCAGTLATTVLGAQTSLPSAEQVQALYEKPPR